MGAIIICVLTSLMLAGCNSNSVDCSSKQDSVYETDTKGILEETELQTIIEVESIELIKETLDAEETTTESITEASTTELIAEASNTESITEVESTTSVESLNTIEKEAEAEMLKRINALRNEYGLNSLEIDTVLYDVAKIRAHEISEKWSHTRPNGARGLDLIPLSYRLAGENLSQCEYAAETFDVTFEALKESVTHLENMIEPEYNNIGIAAYYDEKTNKLYIAYCFGS